ncbi:MAG: mannose-1-phosphate guanylyltransferase [Paludibacteraceae bacterium]|nr:mannose-1-phosphate guanylyltransferase [Paludibacteraceae bacterium]
MAGGVGSRFWPFSRNHKPKQFLDFFGTGRSLLQMTIDRFRPIVPIENILIVTNVLYRDQVLEQIPDLKAEQVLCEPARRNTAPCIAYAAARIKAMEAMRQKGERRKARIVVAPSDHLILQEETFRQTIQQGFDFIDKNDALLTLGMKPTRPETGYGYIQMGENAREASCSLENAREASCSLEAKGEGICKVKAFTEKPNLELAKVFLESGDFLWNSGIFIWSLDSILNAFHAYLPEMANKFAEGENVMGTPEEDAFIQTMFPTCPNISIDYGVMEKAQNVYVIPSDFGWSDLGTWGSLYELSDKDENENVTLHSDATYYDSHGNIVTLPKGHLAVVQGLEDCIVAESDGVLLICKRDAEQQIRQFFMDAEVKFEGKFS